VADFVQVDDGFWVATRPLTPADAAAVAALGVRVLVNNRPDFEEPGQPTGEAVAAAARAAGLAYVAAPVRGRPTREQVEALQAALAEGPAIAACRSGMRSIATWAFGQALSGRPREELVRLAAAAGYDLSGLL
jgi:uncharacterized protein (TIGR01244 family)